MPNWGDENGRYHWTPPGKLWYDAIEIPHPPVNVEKGCLCAFCGHARDEAKAKRAKRKQEPKCP